MKQRFVVEVDIPSGVSVQEMKDYIFGEVRAGIGGLPPEDPLFHLDRTSVKVTLMTRNSKPAFKTTETVELSVDLFLRLSKFAASRGLDVESLIRVATTAIMRANRYYDIDTVVTFGKFSGEKMETIVRLDPGYVSWCAEHISGFCLSEDCSVLLDEMLIKVKNKEPGEGTAL